MAWQTARIGPGYDTLAPDGSEIRLLVTVNGGSMVHCRLQPGQVTQAVRHRSVEEVWFCVAGRGQVWRKWADATASVARGEGTRGEGGMQATDSTRRQDEKSRDGGRQAAHGRRAKVGKSGEGGRQVEARNGGNEGTYAKDGTYAGEVVDVKPGVALSIPLGVAFQFRAWGQEPFDVVITTMPPWPGPDEAVAVEGVWEATD